MILATLTTHRGGVPVPWNMDPPNDMEASRDRQMGGLHFFLPSHFTRLLITAPAQQHPRQDQVSDLQGTQGHSRSQVLGTSQAVVSQSLL